MKNVSLSLSSSFDFPHVKGTKSKTRVVSALQTVRAFLVNRFTLTFHASVFSWIITVKLLFSMLSDFRHE
jgi:hypothetical protein